MIMTDEIQNVIIIIVRSVTKSKKVYLVVFLLVVRNIKIYSRN